MKRITALDSGEQTLTSTGICLEGLREHARGKTGQGDLAHF